MKDCISTFISFISFLSDFSHRWAYLFSSFFLSGLWLANVSGNRARWSLREAYFLSSLSFLFYFSFRGLYVKLSSNLVVRKGSDFLSAFCPFSPFPSFNFRWEFGCLLIELITFGDDPGVIVQCNEVYRPRDDIQQYLSRLSTGFTSLLVLFFAFSIITSEHDLPIVY